MSTDHRAEAARLAELATTGGADGDYVLMKNLALGQLHASISIAESLAAIVGTDQDIDAAVAALASMSSTTITGPEPAGLPDLGSPEAFRYAERVIRHTWRCGPGTRSQQFAQELADRATPAEEVEL